MEVFTELPHFVHDLRSAVDLEALAHRLRVEPMFGVEMRVCREWGIPHSQFLGGDGRWTEDDREKAKAFVMWEQQRCGECGLHATDWPEETSLGDRPPFEVHGSRCYGCQAIHAWLDNFRKVNGRGEDDRSMMWGLRTSLRPTEA